MDNMSIYNSLCTPPNDALKPIGFGNLKGKSDINPQWRYEAVTNQFGACGTGWKYTIDSHWIQPIQQTGETMVYVMISFYYKDGDKWSEPIPAYGGDYLVKKDKNGIHGNDEAMKMAVTDALGTAMKMIGVAADVYRGLIANGASDSKYARRDYMAQTAQNRPQQPAKQNAGTYKGNTANNATDEMRAKALASLTAEKDNLHMGWDEVKKLAISKFNKDTKTLTTGELCELVNIMKEMAKGLEQSA